MLAKARLSIPFAAAMLAGGMLLAACGSSTSGSSEPSAAAAAPESAAAASSSAPESAAAESPAASTGSIVAFMPPSAVPYAASYQAGATAEAEKLGWTITFISNNFDQAEQNNQVQQYISSGETPSVFIWWPSDAKGGLVALNALVATGVPVIQSNQIPSDAEKALVKAYAGVDDAGLGKSVGEYAVEAMAAAKAAGRKLNSENGNAIVIAGPPGYPASVLRVNEITKVLDAAGIKIIGTTDQTAFDAATGYEFSGPLIASTKAEGIDVVVSITDFTTPGVIRALEQNGLTPGKDLDLVSASCSSNSIEQLKKGQGFLTGIQPPRTEGALAVDTAVKVFNGETVEFFNFMPMAKISVDDIDTFTLDGQSVKDLCSQS